MRWKIALAALLFPLSGFAQSVPNGGNITQGTVWTPAQWNNAWQSKLDTTAGGGGGGGSTFNATFPTTGTAIGGNNGGNMVYVGVDAFHDLLVNLATSLPSGSNTIGGVTQSGTWTVGLSGTIGLPAGAATAANQAAVIGAVNGGTSGGNSMLVGGTFNSTPLTLSNTQQAAVQIDTNGYLKVNIAAGSPAGGTSSSFGSTFPGAGTAIGGKNSGNMIPINADASNNLMVNLATAIPVGANVIGGVTQSGTWNVSQATAASLNATVVGAGTAGSANAGVMTVQGVTSMTPVQVSQATASTLNATVVQATGTNLHVVCDTGCTSSSAPADEAAFTAGTTSQTPIGGFFQTSATSNPLTNGQMGAVQLTINRAMMSNLRNAVGVEVGVAATPLQVSLANTGTNATPVVATATLNQGGSALSVTNGIYSNLLQGNAALTTANPIFVQLTAGTALAGKVGIDQTTVGTTNGVSLAQVGANTVLTGNGVSGTGSQRVNIASDNTAFAVNAVTQNNVVGQPHICTNHAFKHITTATDTQIVAQNSTNNIYVCNYSLSANGTQTVFLEKATSGTCATLTQIDQAWYLTQFSGKSGGNDIYHGLNTGASAQLCINTSAAQSVDVSVDYDQY